VENELLFFTEVDTTKSWFSLEHKHEHKHKHKCK